jgi:hypothetical protein
MALYRQEVEEQAKSEMQRQVSGLCRCVVHTSALQPLSPVYQAKVGSRHCLTGAAGAADALH